MLTQTAPSLMQAANAPAATNTGHYLGAADRIRQRLQAAGQRYFANDNIAAYIEDGELEQLQAEVQAKMQEVLHALVIDTDRDHNTADTAKRVAKMFVHEVFQGRYQAAPSSTAFPNISGLGELMVVGPITVRSVCSLHFCPIMGQVWIGVPPNKNSDLIGLSKFARIADWIMSRPQIQEEAIVMLANEIKDILQP